MATTRGVATYKSKNGMLQIFETSDPPKLLWEASDPTVPHPRVEVPLRQLVNVQASTANSEKLLIRVVHESGNGEQQKTVFSFTNKVIMQNFREALKTIVERQESAKETTKQAKDAQLLVYGNKDNLEEILDPKKLLNNYDLHQRLLNSDKALYDLFKQTVIRNKLNPEEFWKTRLHILGTFALKEKAKRGPYNVLSTINLVASSDNKVDLNIPREKIHAIFEQYPIVRRAYEDNVPRVPEGEFWSRFFASKLFHKLKGEKVNAKEKGDIILDPYLRITDEELAEMDRKDLEKRLSDKSEAFKVSDSVDLNVVPRFWDVEANVEDNSQKLGNKSDFTMRPETDHETISAIRGYNRLSKKLVEQVEDEEVLERVKRRKIPEIEDELKKQELLMTDLETDNTTEFLKLQVTDKRRLFNDDSKTANQGVSLDKERIKSTVESMKSYFPTTGAIDLKDVYRDRTAIEAVNKEVIAVILKNAKQPKQNWQLVKSKFDNTESYTRGEQDQVNVNKLHIPADKVEELRTVHVSSIEFLKHFWLHFNSGDAAQANTVSKLYKSVVECIRRVHECIKGVKSLGTTPELEKSYESYAKALLSSLIKSLFKAKKEYEAARESMG